MTRFGPYDRDASCCIARISKDADGGAHRDDRGRWMTTGTMKCGQHHTCPYCGPVKARYTATRLRIAFDRHLLAPEHDVWMLTLEIPHYADTPTEGIVDQLYDSSAALWRTAEWRGFAEQYGLVGKVRVLDVTHGSADGSHPHFHIALFVENAGISTDHAWLLGEHEQKGWTVDEENGVECAAGVKVTPTTLAEERERWGVWKPLRACNKQVRQRWLDEIKGGIVVAWERVVRDAGVVIRNDNAFRRKSVCLTPAEHAAAYFTKWGLAEEVGLSTEKEQNSMRLLDLCAAGVKNARTVWRIWRHAVHGHAMVTGLGDVCKRFNVTDDDAREYQDKLRKARELELELAGTPVVKVRELRVVIRHHLYAAFTCIGPVKVFAWLDKMEPGSTDEDLQYALDAFLWSHMALREDARGSPDH